MNSFGVNFRVQIFGESHGSIIGVILDGVKPGIELSEEDFKADILRRKPGAKGTTPRVESDLPIISSGVFNGKTTGAPLCIQFQNSNIRSKDYDKTRYHFRPSHADFVAENKYKGFQDYRGGGHFSGRLTLCIVAAGVVAKKMFTNLVINAELLEIGGEEDLEKGLQKAIDTKDSIGGIVECKVSGLPVGIGEPFWDSVESTIAHAMFSIPAIKGVEFGAGFQAARMFGAEHNDNILDASGTTETNYSGGVVGGISNGNDLVFRVAVKPTASTGKGQNTFNAATKAVEELKIRGRHDLCIALRVPVVVEAMAAITLADLSLRA